MSNYNLIGPPSKTARDAEKYLYHSGIGGQKHGIRNASHYPLNAGDFSAEELKAGAKESAWAQKSDKGKETVKITKSKLSEESKQALANDKRNQNVINKSQRVDQSSSQKHESHTNQPKQEIIKNKDYYKKTSAGSLTDDELKAAINRINTEDMYNKLTYTPEKQSFGKAMVKKFATQSVESIVNSVSREAGNLVMNKIKEGLAESKADQEEALRREKEAKKARKDRVLDKQISKKISANQSDGKDPLYGLTDKQLDRLNDKAIKETNVRYANGYDDEYTRRGMDLLDKLYNAKNAKERYKILNNASPSDKKKAMDLNKSYGNLYSTNTKQKKHENQNDSNKGNKGNKGNKSNSP